MDPPVDAGVLDRLREDVGGDRHVLDELVATFLTETPRVVAALLEAARAGRWEGVQREAHVLKSTAATFGATRLAQLARGIEADSFGGGAGDSLARQAEAIAAEWARVESALRLT